MQFWWLKKNHCEYINSLITEMQEMLGFYKTWLRPDCRPDCDLTVTRLWPDCRAMISQSGQRWTSQQQLRHTEDITFGAPCFSTPPGRSITWVMLLRNRLPGNSSIFSLRLFWSFLWMQARWPMSTPNFWLYRPGRADWKRGWLL